MVDVFVVVVFGVDVVRVGELTVDLLAMSVRGVRAFLIGGACPGVFLPANGKRKKGI